MKLAAGIILGMAIGSLTTGLAVAGGGSIVGGNAATATSIIGGSACQIPYQSAANTTAFTPNLCWLDNALTIGQSTTTLRPGNLVIDGGQTSYYADSAAGGFQLVISPVSAGLTKGFGAYAGYDNAGMVLLDGSWKGLYFASSAGTEVYGGGGESTLDNDSGGEITLSGVGNIVADPKQGKSFSIFGATFSVISGNVGIGTSNPAQKIHCSSCTILVDGNNTTSISVNGNIEMNSANVRMGTTGVVLGDYFQHWSDGGTPITIGAADAADSINLYSAVGVTIGKTKLAASNLEVFGSFQVGNTVAVSSFTAAGALNMAKNTAITLSGGSGYLISGSSGTFNILQQQEVKSCTLGLKSDANGVITGCVSSDERLKKNIGSYFPFLDAVDRLRPVRYEWKKDDGKVHVGFIAQEVAKIIPQAVVEAGNGMKGVDPNAINALLVAEIQDLRKRVASLESKK